MPVDPIQISGLREFKRDLKALEHDLPKALRMALNESSEVVVTGAQRTVRKRSGKAKRSIKARSTQTKARVQGGGSRAPYLPWLDFGGRVGRRKSVKRPFIQGGRYIYPSFARAAKSGEFQDALEDAIVRVARQAGIEVD